MHRTFPGGVLRKLDSKSPNLQNLSFWNGLAYARIVRGSLIDRNQGEHGKTKQTKFGVLPLSSPSCDEESRSVFMISIRNSSNQGSRITEFKYEMIQYLLEHPAFSQEMHSFMKIESPGPGRKQLLESG